MVTMPPMGLEPADSQLQAPGQPLLTQSSLTDSATRDMSMGSARRFQERFGMVATRSGT